MKTERKTDAQYLTPKQAGALMDPPRSAERIRQLIREDRLPHVDAADVLRGVSTHYKYLIRVEDFEAFLKVERPNRRPLKAVTTRPRPSPMPGRGPGKPRKADAAAG